jgi:hypothetical protein
MVWAAEIPRRSRRIRRVAPWSLALALSVIAPLARSGPTQAATSSATVGASVESWYLGPGTQSAPVAVAPLGGLPAANPYRAGTLHVGVAGGSETARTYLKLDASSLGDAPLHAAKLVLPVDPDDGTLTPEAAQLTLCFAPDPGPAVDGSLSTPPPVDCSASTAATFDATPSPRFVADLAELGIEPAVRTGGIALVPSGAAAANRSSWHVAFYTRSTAPAPADAIHADVELADATVSSPVIAPTIDDVSGTADDGVAGELDTLDEPEPAFDFRDTPFARLEVAEPSVPPALLARPTSGAVLAQPAATTAPPDDGFAYSLVLALPLVLVAAFGLLASALSRPPTVVPTVVEEHKRA